MSEAVIVDKKPTVMELEPGKYYWCSCGSSGNQPFCDGAHQGTDFTPVAFEIFEQQRTVLCLCRRTGNAPFCDGTHTSLWITPADHETDHDMNRETLLSQINMLTLIDQQRKE